MAELMKKKAAAIQKEFYTTLEDYRVYLVDGFAVRTEIAPDFTVGSGYDTEFIPEGEIWVDKMWAMQHEVDIVLLYELFYLTLTDYDIDEDTSERFASDMEGVLRKFRQEKCFEKIIEEREKGTTRDDLDKRLIGEFLGHTVYLVSGRYVRDNVNSDWLAGNGPADEFIPEGEIWIDMAITPKEVYYYVIHEVAEAQLMKGFNRNYEEAHDCATELEDWARTLEDSKPVQELKRGFLSRSFALLSKDLKDEYLSKYKEVTPLNLKKFYNELQKDNRTEEARIIWLWAFDQGIKIDEFTVAKNKRRMERNG